MFTTGVTLHDFVAIHANCFIGHESELEHYCSDARCKCMWQCGARPLLLHRGGCTSVGQSRTQNAYRGRSGRGCGGRITRCIPRDVTVVGIPASNTTLVGDG